MRTRRGKSSPWARKHFTVAQADPVRVIGGKQQTQGLVDLGIGIQDDALVLRVEQTDRQRHFQRGATGFVENPALQACLQDMELGLRHGSL